MSPYITDCRPSLSTSSVTAKHLLNIMAVSYVIKWPTKAVLMFNYAVSCEPFSQTFLIFFSSPCHNSMTHVFTKHHSSSTVYASTRSGRVHFPTWELRWTVMGDWQISSKDYSHTRLQVPEMHSCVVHWPSVGQCSDVRAWHATWGSKPSYGLAPSSVFQTCASVLMTS